MEEMILKNGISPAEKIPPWKEILSKIESIDSKIRNFGPVNMKALQRYEEVKKRRDESREKRNTLERERAEIIERIKKCEQMKHDAFMDAFNQINSNFKEIFSELSDGYGELVLENPENPFDGGMVIKAQPAGKTLLNIEARSGGEQSLIALSLLFSLQRYRPAPFYALDEVDTHLDPLNVEKVARMIKECSRDTQFIVVTLREQMIKAADRIIGIAMQETDVSTVTGILPSEFENA
jgi:chromosome segregation protein